MAVIAEVLLRGVTPEQYDAVRAGTGWLERAPEGGLAHLTWWEGPDCHSIDCWESEAAFAAFGEQRLTPAMRSLGLEVQPEMSFHPAHEAYTPYRGAVGPTVPASIGGDHVAVVRSGYQHFAERNIPAVLALFDPGIDWYSPDSVHGGGRYVGPEAVARFFGTIPENWSELSVEPQQFIESGDTVVVLGRHRGRTVAGNPVELPFVHVWTLRDGRATSFTEHFDSSKLNAALGRSPVEVMA